MGEVNTNFSLPEKTVQVNFISRKRGMAAGDHIGEDHVISGGMLDGSSKKFTAPLKRNGAIANVLTKVEKAYLESIMPGVDLSVYGNFWRDYYVTLYKKGNNLNLSDPYDYISYKILLSLKDKIAPRWSERLKKPTYQFVLTEEGAEDKEVKKTLDVKKEAFKLYGKFEDNRDQMLGILKLITNKPISNDSKLDWIQGKVEAYLDENPSKFVSLVKDSALHTKIMFTKAIEYGVIIKEGNTYKTVDGLDLCENGSVASYNNAIAYLDNDKNQEVRAMVEARITNAE